MNVGAGQPFRPHVSNAPAGEAGNIGLAIYDPMSATYVVPRFTEGITEEPPNSGVYYAPEQAALPAGTYQLIWDSPLSPPDAIENLIVGVGDGSARPTVDEVAALERTRTVTAGGNEVGTFTDQTRPTATEVENLITFAIGLMTDQPVYLRTKGVATILTALLIEESYFRDDAAVARFRDMLMRLGFVIPVGGAGGGPASARQVDSVVMRSTMSDYDPFYPKPVPLPDWPFVGANPDG